MNLQKAIELNKESERSLRDHKFIDHADAILLGIEALNRALLYRKGMYIGLGDKMPGETKE